MRISKGVMCQGCVQPGRYVCGFCVIELYRPEIAVMIKLQLNGIVERD